MRETSQARTTLEAVSNGYTTVESLSHKLAIPYSSCTGRVRRLIKSGQLKVSGYTAQGAQILAPAALAAAS